jgi:hypothetical protein
LATALRETALQSIGHRVESAFAVALVGLMRSSRSARYGIPFVSSHHGGGSLASPLPPWRSTVAGGAFEVFP